MRNIIKGHQPNPTKSPKTSLLHSIATSQEFPDRQAMARAVTAMAAIAAFPAPRSLQQAPTPLQLRQNAVSFVARPVRAHRRLVAVAASSPATPPDLASKVSESIEHAKEACADDPVSGECAAAWDEVEELSAAASHARDRQKGADPLEEYCKDNPETDECRMYED